MLRRFQLAFHERLVDGHLYGDIGDFFLLPTLYLPSFLLNFLNTQIAMVEAGEGVAIIPSYGLPACRNRRVVMSRLINPVVHTDFNEIRHAGRKLPPVAEEFTYFLQSYIARWAGRSGVL
jgi:DNA-binding transcriptional LysR family regulator